MRDYVYYEQVTEAIADYCIHSRLFHKNSEYGYFEIKECFQFSIVLDSHCYDKYEKKIMVNFNENSIRIAYLFKVSIGDDIVTFYYVDLHKFENKILLLPASIVEHLDVVLKKFDENFVANKEKYDNIILEVISSVSQSKRKTLKNKSLAVVNIVPDKDAIDIIYNDNPESLNKVITNRLL